MVGISEKFIQYLKATGGKPSMNRNEQKKSGLTIEEFICFHDNFNEMKYLVMLDIGFRHCGYDKQCENLINKLTKY